MIARLDAAWYYLVVLTTTAWTDGNDSGVEYFSGRLVRDHDAALGGSLAGKSLNKDAIEQWNQTLDGTRLDKIKSDKLKFFNKVLFIIRTLEGVIYHFLKP